MVVIQRAVECAKVSSYIDRMTASTDDALIADASLIYGAEVYSRHDAMATDTSLVTDTVRNLIEQLRQVGELDETCACLSQRHH